MKSIAGKFRLFFCAITLVAASAAAVSAAPPRINMLDPVAVQRGVQGQLGIEGKYLAGASRLYLPFKAKVEFEGAIDEQTRFLITPAAEIRAGAYPIRVISPDGISNLRWMLITDVPVVRAKEPNGTYKSGRIQLDQAQRVEWPAVISGGRMVYDLDLWRFTVKAGQRLIVTTQSRQIGLTVDPILRLRDNRGRTMLVRHDTPGLRGDERIDFTFSKAGDYFIEMRCYGSNGWNNHYSMRIGPADYAKTVFPLGGRRGARTKFEVVASDGSRSKIEHTVPTDPWSDRWQLALPEHPNSLPWKMVSGDLTEIQEPTFDANSSKQTGLQPVKWPVTINGRIERPNHGDEFQIDVEPEQHVRIQVNAFFLGSHLDGYLMVYDPIGKKLLAKSDDQRYRGNPDPGLSFQVPKGVEKVVIALRDTLGRGGIEFPYRMTIDRGGPDFYLWLGDPQTPYTDEGIGWLKMDGSDTLNLKVGQSVTFPISVRRKGKDDTGYVGPIQGYQGPIQLTAIDLPKGVTANSVMIPSDQLRGELVFQTTNAAPKQPFEIAIVGEATRQDGSKIRRIAERRIYTSNPQMTILPWDGRITKLTCFVTEATDASSE